MSYDIRFGVKVAGCKDDVYAVIGHPEYDSPTYNLRDMFVACMDWDYTQGEWYHMPDVLPAIRRGVTELVCHPEKYRKYEPDNGWGNLNSAYTALKSILDWFSDDSARGWNDEIPLDAIYMRW